MVKWRFELQMQLTVTTPSREKGIQKSPRLRSNKSPSGAFKSALADGGALPRQAPQAFLNPE